MANLTLNRPRKDRFASPLQLSFEPAHLLPQPNYTDNSCLRGCRTSRSVSSGSTIRVASTQLCQETTRGRDFWDAAWPDEVVVVAWHSATSMRGRRRLHSLQPSPRRAWRRRHRLWCHCHTCRGGRALELRVTKAARSEPRPGPLQTPACIASSYHSHCWTEEDLGGAVLSLWSPRAWRRRNALGEAPSSCSQ
jgi:hypothetical protein